MGARRGSARGRRRRVARWIDRARRAPAPAPVEPSKEAAEDASTANPWALVLHTEHHMTMLPPLYFPTRTAAEEYAAKYHPAQTPTYANVLTRRRPHPTVEDVLALGRPPRDRKKWGDE